jgi:transcriptional regulator with XRE-family HTH domain
MAVDYESMGRIIRKLREEKQISQEEFGSILLTSNVHISNIETGSRAPSLDLFVAIANALDVSADDLLIDSLNHSSSDAGKEVHSLLMTCNHDEKEMLIRTLQFLKALFSEFGI